MSFSTPSKQKGLQILGKNYQNCASGHWCTGKLSDELKQITNEDLLEELLGKKWIIRGATALSDEKLSKGAKGIISGISISDEPHTPVSGYPDTIGPRAYLVLDYLLHHEGDHPLGDVGSENRFIQVQPFAKLKEIVEKVPEKRMELWYLLHKDNDIEWGFELEDGHWVDLEGF